MVKALIGGLLAASVVLGAHAYRRYLSSEREIRAAADAMRTAGPRLDTEGCVTEALAFGKRCGAIANMCEEAVAPLVRTCLMGQDRGAYCRAIGPRASDTHFTFARCRERGRSRRDHNCAEAYLAVVAHCREPGRTP
ncbi:MAG TPA: hypothetical protein VGQ83_13995 [Polyangia bacterium]|jgi:hypothetical protein